MLQDFLRVQHLNLKIDGDGLFSMLASLYTSLQKHSCACCVVANAQNLSWHSYSQMLVGQLSSRQANARSSGVSPVLSCADGAGAGDTWLGLQWRQGLNQGWCGELSVDLWRPGGQGEWNTELGVRSGTHTRHNIMGRKLVRNEARKCWDRQIQIRFRLLFCKPRRRSSVPYPLITTPALLPSPPPPPFLHYVHYPVACLNTGDATLRCLSALHSAETYPAFSTQFVLRNIRRLKWPFKTSINCEFQHEVNGRRM